MPKQPFLVSIRVWGDFACFTRPELKAERVSYGLPTPSAARGILESIFYEPQMSYVIHEIGVIKRGRWFSFRRNEVARVVSIRETLRAMSGSAEMGVIRAGGGAADATQRGMLALADVEYLISAEIRLTDRAEPPRDNLEKYRARFIDRASKGKCFQRPYLGCREFAADFEHISDPSAVILLGDGWRGEDLGMMLYDVFDPLRRNSGKPVKPDPVFFRNARVENARLDCHPERVALVRRPGGTL